MQESGRSGCIRLPCQGDAVVTERKLGRAFLLGDICIDLSLEIPEVMGNATGQQEPVSNGGGTVANAAYALAKLGLETHFLGTAGDDFAGRLVKRELNQRGVNTEGMAVSLDRPTPQVISLADGTGQRTTFLWPSARPAYSELHDFQLQFLRLAPADWLHTSGICLTEKQGAEVTLAALKIARRAGCTSSFDLSLRFGLRHGSLPPRFRACLWDAINLVTYVLGSVEEELFHLVPSVSDARQATEALAGAGKCVAVMRESGVGAHVSAYGAACFTVPQFQTPAVDTLGAGDAFAAGFILGGMHGKSLPEQVRWAHAVAGYKVGGRGARHLPDQEELDRFLCDFR